MTPKLVSDQADSISARFKQVVLHNSTLAAIKTEDETTSFRELDKYSDQLAKLVVERIGNDPHPVALFLEDNREMIISILSVIRAGHFYCALSHKDSIARTREVLIDLNPCLLITDKKSFPLVKDILPSSCQVLLYPDFHENQEAEISIQVDPKSILGVFYTSGSTGAPKGILRTHEHILHRLQVDLDDYKIGVADKLLYMRQFNVSSSLSSLFDALLSGATLVSYDVETIGIAGLSEVLNKEKITIFPPPIELLRRFLDSLAEDIIFSTIRCVILGGDVLYKRDVERLRMHIPEEAIIIHHLSSSESGLLARKILKYDSIIEGDLVPLGYPVPEKEILILDQETGEVIRDGKPGEIVVRSNIQFPGYWRLPDLEKDKFIPDPDDPLKRVFCTGDLGYFHPDGQLIFLGREDFRLKIRGFTVDLAIIESSLMENPEVKRAVVTAHLDPKGHKRLVAYVLLIPGSEETRTSLREHVKKSLPEYMVPPIFLIVEEMPLTSTFKIDRKALPLPDWRQLFHQSSYSPPSDEIEARLVTIWQKVHGIENIGIDDHFFDIGGDSLMVMELILQIAKEFDIHIPARLLIAKDTIRDLATLLREPNLIHQEMIVELSLSGKGTPVFLIPGGNGEIFSMLHLARSLEGKQPIYGLQAAGEGGKHLYKQPVEEIAAQFIKEIKKIQSKGPYRLIGGSFGGVVVFEMAKKLSKNGDKVELTGMIDTMPPGPRRKAKFSTRIRIHWKNIRSIPLSKIPDYLSNWWKIFLLGLARHKLFRRFFSYKRLDKAIKGTEVIRAGRTAYALYDPQPYPGDVVLFKAKKRPWYIDWEPTDAWRKYILGKLMTAEVDGTHGLIYKPPYVEKLAEAIRNFL